VAFAEQVFQSELRLRNGNSSDTIKAVRARANHLTPESDPVSNLDAVRVAIRHQVDRKENDLDPCVRFDDTVLAIPLNDVPPHFCDLDSGHGVGLH
jgi:hypothetical protein